MSRPFALSLAILLCLTAVAQTAPTIVVGNHALLPNTAGQTIQLTVTGITTGDNTGIAPGSVKGIMGGWQIGGGGPDYGYAAGPKITGIDFDAGPSIWVAPNSAGHTPPNIFFDPGGQLVIGDIVTTAGFVLVNS